MNRTRRIAAALVATAAIAAPTTVTMSAAEAKPHGDKPAKAQTKQLLKDIAGKDKHLAKLLTSHQVTDLADDTEAELVATITEDRADLSALATAVQAPGSTVDTRAARKELHAFRVQNLRHAAHVLRHVEELADDAAGDPEAQALLAQAQAAALAIESVSSKDQVHAAKALVGSARAELGLADDEDDDEDEDAPTT